MSHDPSRYPFERIFDTVAAASLLRADASKALRVLAGYADWSKNDVFITLEALNALDALGDRAASLRPMIQTLPTDGPMPDARYDTYVLRLVTGLKQRFP